MYERVCLPAVGAIGAEGLDARYPDATTADLFLHLYRRRRERVPDRGCTPLEQAALELAADRSRRRPSRLGRVAA